MSAITANNIVTTSNNNAIAEKVMGELFYQTHFKQLIFINYLNSELETRDMILVPKELLVNLSLNENVVNNMLTKKTKVLHKPRHYDYENEQWIGQYGFWFEVIK